MCVVLSKGSIQGMGLPVSNNAACDGHGNPLMGSSKLSEGYHRPGATLLLPQEAAAPAFQS